MKHLERVMRVMTHLNIGATLGTAAWILWTGPLIVSGQLATPPQTATPPGAQALPAPLGDVPSCCWSPAAPARNAPTPTTRRGEDAVLTASSTVPVPQ